MKLSAQHKGKKLDEIPSQDISKRYGNQEGSFILYCDGSKGWIDPINNKVLMFINWH